MGTPQLLAGIWARPVPLLAKTNIINHHSHKLSMYMCYLTFQIIIDPLGESGDCSFPLYFTRILTQYSAL